MRGRGKTGIQIYLKNKIWIPGSSLPAGRQARELVLAPDAGNDRLKQFYNLKISKQMKDFFKNFKSYLKLPEMNIFWLFLFLILLIFIIDISYLDPFWTFASLLILFAVGIVMFVIIIRSSKTNIQLRIEKARVDNIITSMRDGVVIYNPEFEVVLFNRGAEAIFNLNNNEIIGKKLSPDSARDPKLGVLARVVFQSLAPAVIQQTEEGVYPQIADISFGDPHLELRVVSDKMVDDSGKITGFVKIIRDQTREIDLIKSKSDFITIAAHQLRTPLSAVSWTFQSLKNEQLNDNQKDLVNTGLSASANLLKIVEDLLNISKIEEGKFGYNFQEIDLISFLQSVINQAGPVAKEYNVEVFMQPSRETSVKIMADPEKLAIAVSNLLENGIKYNIPNGRVTLSVERRADAPYMQVNIADTGMGIPEDALDKLFTKFFRAENVMSKETEGSGLGLYMVKNIIKRHGGDVWAESVAGRGSVFHFALPTDPNLIPKKEIGVNE